MTAFLVTTGCLVLAIYALKKAIDSDYGNNNPPW